MNRALHPGTRRPLAGLILAATAAAIALGACGMFDIREPVAPPGGGTNECAGKLANAPEIVLENFAVAMRCGRDGIGLYEQTLGDHFALELDPLDAGDLGGRDTLSRAEELQAQQTIVNDVADSLYFEFTLVTPERGDVSAFYQDMPYRLEVISREESTPEVVATYSGTVDLTVVEAGAGRWVMERWKDQGDQSGNATLGAFHGKYAIEQPGAASRRMLDLR